MTTNELPPRPEPFSEANGSYFWNHDTQTWDYYIVTTRQGTVKIENAITDE